MGSRIKLKCAGCSECATPCELTVDSDNPAEVPDNCIRFNKGNYAKWIIQTPPPKKLEVDQENVPDASRTVGGYGFRIKKPGEKWKLEDWQYAVDMGVWVLIHKTDNRALLNKVFYSPGIMYSLQTSKIYLQGVDAQNVLVNFEGPEGEWHKPEGDVIEMMGGYEDEDDAEDQKQEWE